MVLNEIEYEYNSRIIRYKKLKDEVIFFLRNSIESQSVPYDAIYGRVKELDSFKRKILDNEYDNPFEEIYPYNDTYSQ
jgi:hypothetical protein